MKKKQDVAAMHVRVRPSVRSTMRVAGYAFG
jgi:hypothetical protein